MFTPSKKNRHFNELRTIAITWFSAGAGFLLLFFAGCGSGDLTAPDDIIASWDRLEFRALSFQDRLEINNTGNIVLFGGDEGAEAGILGPQTWHSLEAALAGAELAPLSTFAPGDQDEGIFILERSGKSLGFIWADASNLTSEQLAVVALLDEIRLEALTPASERIGLRSGQRLLHGYDATIDHEARYLIRDVDALLGILKNDLGRETVIIPEVDFKTEMVLAVFLGPRTHQTYDIEIMDEISLMISGCYQISITQYTRDESCPISPSSGGVFELLKLPKQDQDVYLDWQVVETGCANNR